MAEVDVARITVQRALTIYEQCLTDPNSADAEDLARETLRDAMILVERLLSSQAKLEALMSPFDVETLVKRVEQVIHRHLRNDPEMFDKICEDLRSLDLSKQGHSQINIVID